MTILDHADIVSKLWERTIVDPKTGCWLWQNYTDYKGYGIIRIGRKTYKVHRLSACIFLNLDMNNKELQAAHKLECLNKNCWNPDHLKICDNFDNQQDKIKLGKTHKGMPAINAEKMYCINDHPLFGDNLYIAKDGRRRCKICRLNNAKKHDQRKIELTRQKFNKPTTNNQI